MVFIPIHTATGAIQIHQDSWPSRNLPNVCLCQINSLERYWLPVLTICRISPFRKSLEVVKWKLCSWKSRDLLSQRAFSIFAKIARSCTRECEAGEKQNDQANFDKCHGRSTPHTGLITAHGEAPLFYATRCTFCQLAPGDVRNVQM